MNYSHFPAEIAKLLLGHATINPNAKNIAGDTPLHLASKRAFFEAVYLLVKDPRCNPLETNSRGDTALHTACHWKKTGELKVLYIPALCVTVLQIIIVLPCITNKCVFKRLKVSRHSLVYI